MTGRAYQIVCYEPRFRTGVLDVQRHHWGSDRRLNAAYFDWKYHTNPYIDQPLVFVALCGDRVVGMRGMWGSQWELGRPARRHYLPCAGDVVIDPKHRRRGLFAQLNQAALEELARRGYPFALNLSAGPVTHITSVSLGWRAIGALQRWDLVTADSAGDPFAPLDAAVGRAEKPVGIASTARPDFMASVVEASGYGGQLRHVRDVRYHAWRYRNPFSRYRFLFWEDADNGGYLVLQAPARNGSKEVSILDWEAPDPSVRLRLLETALRLARFAQLSIWAATLGAPLRAELELRGFRPWRHSGPLGATRPTVLATPTGCKSREDWHLEGRSLLDLNNWDLRMVHSDAY